MTIVEELRADRERGAKRLEAEYKAGLMTLARRFCADPGDAEELVNATFAAVVDSIDNYLEQSAFFGWMSQILTNIYTMDSRRKSRQTVTCPGIVPDCPDDTAQEAIYDNLDAAQTPTPSPSPRFTAPRTATSWGPPRHSQRHTTPRPSS